MMTWLSGLTPENDEAPDATVWARLRYLRNDLLAASDARVGPDAPGDVDAWRTYRQALRDLPANTTDPRQAVWPEAPTSEVRNPTRAAIEQQAATALDGNRTFLAIPTPSAAQNAQQIKALTRQNQGILRLLLGDVTGTD